ncbi:T9SS type A sorting domain-containing protein [Croceibacter atlanticus]|jgi:hypothetical protein|uniref:T9SS type A sorting domain-containing protein n=1 Tax=Croceibacter atlanticus TaxID=313588 RepID=UPI0030F94407
MKSTITLVILFISFIAFGQTTTVPDDVFEQALIDQGIDSDGTLNDTVLTSDLEAVTELLIFSPTSSIQDMTGIEAFVNLESLELLEHDFNSLNISNSVNLTFLNISTVFNLTSIDVSSNINLTHLFISETSLSSINLSNNIDLQFLELSQNRLSEIDITNNTELIEVDFSNYNFDTLPGNIFTTVDLSNNQLLTKFSCFHCDDLSSLDVTPLPDLRELHVAFCNLETIDVSTNIFLEEITLGAGFNSFFENSNELESVDLSQNPNLTRVNVTNTLISSFNLNNENNESIISMRAGDNPDLNCILVDNEDQAASGTGNYANWVYDDDVTSFSDTECVLSVAEKRLQELQVYPNPVTNRLFVQSNQPLQHLAVYNLRGQLLRQSEQSQFINVSSLASGLYIVKLTTLEGIRHVRFIKE